MEKYAARNVKFQFALLELPNELISLVVELVDDLAALKRLACTCSRLQQLTEPVLWRRLLITESTRLRGALLSMHHRRDRASALQVLNVPCRDDFTHIISLARLLMRATNLKDFIFESPSCNSMEFESHEVWNPMMDQLFFPFQLACLRKTSSPLQKLKRVTLHLNGPESPYWTPDERSVSVFLHPSLEYLHISCVSLPEDLFNEVKERAVTPLKELVLEECNISHQGLHGLLALPKALEHLTLGENCHNERQFDQYIPLIYNHLFRMDAGATVEALAQQKHSLRTLKYAAAGSYLVVPGQALGSIIRRQPGVDAGFAEFFCLDSVTFTGVCTTFERALFSSQAPPNLRSLSYESDHPLHFPRSLEVELSDDKLISYLPFFRAPSASIPATLRDLKLTIFKRHVQDPTVPRSDYDQMLKVATALKGRHDITFKLAFKSLGRYYPPFLHGEPEPEELLLYDSATQYTHPSIPCNSYMRTRGGHQYIIDYSSDSDV